MPRTRTKTPKTQAVPGTKIQLKWIRSMICTPEKQRLVIKGLGFTRLNQVIEREDTLSVRGMVAKVPHMVQILEPGK
jgi:large subunit ribosomal protein L30